MRDRKAREDETPVGMQEKEYHSDFRKAPDGSTLVKASGILTKQAVAAATPRCDDVPHGRKFQRPLGRTLNDGP